VRLGESDQETGLGINTDESLYRRWHSIRCSQTKQAITAQDTVAFSLIEGGRDRFGRQIAIPETVKDFHETCGYFCGKLGSREVA
jgi:hypothetical protein